MFDLWMILVPGSILVLVAGIGLLMPTTTRRAGLTMVVVGATFLCAGILRAWHRNNVVMSIAKAHQQVQNDMTKAEVQALLGLPDRVASADPTGKLQVPWENQRKFYSPDVVLAWEYRPYGGLHFYGVYFDGDGRVVGKDAD